MELWFEMHPHRRHQAPAVSPTAQAAMLRSRAPMRGPRAARCCLVQRPRSPLALTAAGRQISCVCRYLLCRAMHGGCLAG